MILNYLRRWKYAYTIYNFFHQKQLAHNANAYKKFHIKQPLFFPIESKMLQSIPYDLTDIPWSDRYQTWDDFLNHESIGHLEESQIELLRQWFDLGYVIIPQAIDTDRADQISNEVERLLSTGKVKWRYGNKVMFANKYSELIHQVTKDESIISVLELLTGTQVIPFQTINFKTGSQQRAHSDSIHMTTFPPGHLVAIWIALEDIHEDQGPLFYYPGSHKYPYLLKPQYPSGDNQFLIGEYSYNAYEKAVSQTLQKHQAEKKHFLARKGDILIWHANLLHGGESIKREGATRKSMVVHYYSKDVIKYHEITSRPALL
jgi:ectoine hydroxylase